LAANPNDRNRVGAGVPLATLKRQAQLAIAACEEAVRQSPDEPRLRYQLARAFQTVDRDKAFGMLEGLVARGYPAAHDNFGWMLYDDKKMKARAVEIFRRGVSLGDPDSMLSLAEMVDREDTEPRNGSETKISLYTRACQLGHERACQAATAENEREARRARDLQEQKQALELFQGILRSIPMRR
jgi:TPR repeat protein